MTTKQQYAAVKDYDEEEEEYKFSFDAVESTKTHSKITEFVQPRRSDYIDCKIKYHQIDNCNIVNRVVHLMIWYHQHENVNIYEYMCSLKNYNISTFME
eukprot:263242_1